MEASAVQQAILDACAVLKKDFVQAHDNLKADFQTQQVVLKSALDKEFDTIRKNSAEATEAVKETFRIAGQQVRDDQTAQLNRIKEVELSVENIELILGEQRQQLQKYEQQEDDKHKR